MDLAKRYQSLQQALADCAVQHGRRAPSVHLLAVSKHQPIDAIQQLMACGQRDFGENTVQEALPKIEALNGHHLIWHFIGRIQSRKTRDIAKHFTWVHGLTDIAIAERLNHHRTDHSEPLKVLIQVNISGEASKAGTPPEALLPLAKAVNALPHLQLRGLMTMAPIDANEAACLAIFKQLATLKKECVNKGIPMDHLSMGMSGDYPSAIEAGATWVRIGSKLFSDA